MGRNSEIADVLRRHLYDEHSGWSLGSYGVIAEFHWDAADLPFAVDAREDLTVASARGALRIRLCDGVRPLAYETLSVYRHRWQHGVVLCLPAAAARLERRTVLSELGPDMQSVRERDRAAVLFDLGLDQPQTVACVRTADPALLAVLRANLGRRVFGDGRAAMEAILARHPHRVFITRLGRVEVYQRIGSPEPGARTPEGPHTHVLPKLMAHGRTHSANIPVPEGYLPCLSLYPPHPVVDRLGRDETFDAARHAAFQALLARWGDRHYLAAKADAMRALTAGAAPESFACRNSRLARAAARIALRQQSRMGGSGALLEAWRSAFDLKNARAPGGRAH